MATKVEIMVQWLESLVGKESWTRPSGGTQTSYYHCQSLARDAYEKAGELGNKFEGAYQAQTHLKEINKLYTSKDFSKIPAGACIYYYGPGYSTDYGHVCICVGNGQMIEAGNQKIQKGEIKSNSFQGYGWPPEGVPIQGAAVNKSNYSWMELVKYVHKYGAQKKWTYSQTETRKIIWNNKEYDCRSDCSGFPSICLRLAGVITSDLDSKSFADPNNETLKNTGLTAYTFNSWDDCKPGDILARNGHAEIFAEKKDGKYYVYNWGYTSDIQTEGATEAKNKNHTTIWRGMNARVVEGTSGGNSGGNYVPNISAAEESAVIESNKKSIELLKTKGIPTEISNGYAKMDYSGTFKDYILFNNVHKLDGVQYNPNAMSRKNFKQDYVVLIRKKLYFAATMESEENYLRLYHIDTFTSINISHNVESAASCNLTLKGAERITCVSNPFEEGEDWVDYEHILNGFTNIDNEGETNNIDWRMGTSKYNDPTAEGVDFNDLIRAKKAKYGWRFAEKCDWEPMDEIIVFSKSRTERTESGLFKFKRIFFGFIDKVNKKYAAGASEPTISISARDHMKLLDNSYVNKSPSYLPGRVNGGYVDLTFETNEFGMFKLNEPLAYSAGELTDEQKATMTNQYMGTNIFYGRYPDEIIKNLCFQAGIPARYLNTRIEPIKAVPYLFQSNGGNFDFFSASFEKRSAFCQEIAKICFCEFFFDEEGNAVFKIPTYTLGVNSLIPNNDYFDKNQLQDSIKSKIGTREKMPDLFLQLKAMCNLVTPLIHTTTDNESLRTISQKYYNTPNYAVEIQVLNIGQCQNYNTGTLLKSGIRLLILMFDVKNLYARAEYRNILFNQLTTNCANNLYLEAMNMKPENKEIGLSTLTDTSIRIIKDEDIISFTLTDSDDKIYNCVDVVGQTFTGIWQADAMTQVRQTIPNIDCILRFGVRVAPSLSTPFVQTDREAQIMGTMILLKSYASRYTATLEMIEDPDIKVGIPIRLFTYDEHPQQESDIFVNTTQYQSIYYVNNISRSINISGVSKMTLSLTAGRMLGQQSIFDIMDSLYLMFYNEPSDENIQKARSYIENNWSGSNNMSNDNVKDVLEYGTGDDPNQTAPPVGTTTDKIYGTEVKARFTGYYPANDSMEGGYNDCKGKKLNPDRQTCAAPKSIPYGSLIWIENSGTCTTNLAGRLYVVTDVGGDINIDSDGSYHFDILCHNKSETNKVTGTGGKVVIYKRS